MKIVFIIYLVTVSLCALMILITTLEMRAYVKKHNLKRRETITPVERITGNLKLVIISIIPIYNILVVFSLLSSTGRYQIEKTIHEQFCEKEE